MPLQNRLSPCGQILAVNARGTFMGNRGGAIHNDKRQIVSSVFSDLGEESTTSTALFQRSTRGSSVPQLTPLDWAHESNELARRDVYQKLNLPNHTAAANKCAPRIGRTTLTQRYLDGNRADVEQQLMRAGIRLSAILNQICAGTGFAANPDAAPRGGRY
jgi:S1/P1 Nuclease